MQVSILPEPPGPTSDMLVCRPRNTCARCCSHPARRGVPPGERAYPSVRPDPGGAAPPAGERNRFAAWPFRRPAASSDVDDATASPRGRRRTWGARNGSRISATDLADDTLARQSLGRLLPTALAASLLTAALNPPLHAAQDGTPPAAKQLQTESEKASYALGMQIGKHVKGLPAGIDLELFLRGVRDTVSGHTPLLTQDEALKVQQRFFKDNQAKQGKRWEETGRKNKQEGAAFLAANRKKAGVKTTRSGLQYAVIREGDGGKPKKKDRVRVHYRGTLLDGTEFDSSYSRDEPATFELRRVIPGWTEAIQLMRVVSKYRLFIPSELAYRERGAGPEIGPHATLIFEVELLGIEK